MIQNATYSREVMDAFARGDIRAANELKGSVYCIEALVVHGNHLGRTLGYPTANLQLSASEHFLPANGVYAVTAGVNQHVYQGMANAGLRPTIDGKGLTVEVNLFEFSGDLYGQTLMVCFYHRIRDEKKFDSLNDLVEQLHEDKKEALRLLSSADHPDPNPENSLSR